MKKISITALACLISATQLYAADFEIFASNPHVEFFCQDINSLVVIKQPLNSKLGMTTDYSKVTNVSISTSDCKAAAQSKKNAAYTTGIEVKLDINSSDADNRSTYGSTRLVKIFDVRKITYVAK